jgi:hypothetical protein
VLQSKEAVAERIFMQLCQFFVCHSSMVYELHLVILRTPWL